MIDRMRNRMLPRSAPSSDPLSSSRLLDGVMQVRAILVFADGNQRVVAASQAATDAVRSLGFVEGSLEGRELAELHGNPPGFRAGAEGAAATQPYEHKIRTDTSAFKCLVTRLVDADGVTTGYVAAWEDQTKRQRVEVELGRVLSMIESCPTNIICGDPDLTMQYINPAGRRSLEALGKVMPLQPDQVAGQPMTAFLAPSADTGRRLLDPKNLPYRERVTFGPETVDLQISATYDHQQRYIGPMLTWEVITATLTAERTIATAHEREHRESLELRAKVDGILSAVRAAAAGDLTATVSVSGNDAIGQLGDGLATFLENQRKSVAEIAGHARTLATAAEELSSVNRTVTDGAAETTTRAQVVASASDEVARNIQTVAAGTEEMGASIREIAKNASDAAKVAVDAVGLADRTNTMMAKLGDSSQEIGKVVKLITSIAQQTNLLALNATIEAARAGEAGKGFAVVAKEVKELAKETARATEEIGQRIDAIQGDTGRAVTAIREIGGIITKVSDIQTVIAGAVEEQTATTSEMARNISDAAKGAGEITHTIGSVAQSAESTSAITGNSQRATQELAAMAADLQRLVGRFTI